MALLALAAAGYLQRARNDDDDSRSSALAAARLYAVDLTTYDFASVDADFQRFARHGTTEFKTSYAATIATSKPAIVKAQSRSLGTVVAAGLESWSDRKAVVLLAVDQEIRSATRPGPTEDHSRIRMTLVRAADSWLISAVSVL